MIERINLLPRAYVSSRRFSARRFGLVAGGLALAAMLAAFALYQSLRVRQLSREYEQAALTESRLSAEFSRLSQSVGSLEGVLRDTAELGRRVSIIEDLSRRRVRWSAALSNLAAVMPRTIWLADLNAGAGDEEAAGPTRMVLHGYAASNSVLADFMADLDRSGRFQGTDLIYVRTSQYRDREVYEFQVATGIVSE